MALSLVRELIPRVSYLKIKFNDYMKIIWR